MKELLKSKKLSRRKFLGVTAAAGALVSTDIGLLQQAKAVENTKPYGAFTGEPDKVVRAVCSPNCTGTCGINTYVKNDKIIRVEPADFPDPAYKRICIKGISYAMQRVYHNDRVKYPLKRVEGSKRGDGKYMRISWKQAYAEIAQRLNAIKAKYGAETCGWATMTGNYGILATYTGHRFADCFGGTVMDTVGIMGDAAANMGFMITTGAPPHHSQEGHDLAQLKETKMMMFWGCNFAETSTPDMHFYLDAKKNGAEMVVIDPRFSTMASKADTYVQIRPATDAALAYGMIQHIIAKKLHDVDYIRANTSAAFLVRDDNKKHAVNKNGKFYVFNKGKAEEIEQGGSVPATAELLPGSVTVNIDGKNVKCRSVFQLFTDKMNAEYTPAKASKICEVPESTIKSLAEKYAKTNPAATYISQGTQRYYSGHLSYRAVIILGAVCGKIGKRASGVSWTGGTLFKAIFANPMEWGRPVKFADPNNIAWDKGSKTLFMSEIYKQMETGKPYPLHALWVTSYGIGTQHPERKRLLEEVFPKLDLIVINENMMTEGAMHADYILPVTSYYEQKADIVGSWMNLYLQYRKPAISPMYEAKDDVEIFSELAKYMKLPGNWGMTPEEHCDFIMKSYKTTKGPFTNKAFQNMDIQKLKADGVVRIAYPVDYVPFSDQKFATQTGKLSLYQENLIPVGEEVPLFKESAEGKYSPIAGKYPLVMMNTHHKYSAHSHHRILDWINEMDPEPRMEISPVDASARGLNNGDLVEVFNDRGSFKVKVLVTDGIKEGVLNLGQGWWSKHFPDKTHYADLLHMKLSPSQQIIMETNYAPYDNLVQVRKIGGAK